MLVRPAFEERVLMVNDGGWLSEDDRDGIEPDLIPRDTGVCAVASGRSAYKSLPEAVLEPFQNTLARIVIVFTFCSSLSCTTNGKRNVAGAVGSYLGMTEDVLANIKGKTVENVDDLAPNVRITFTDGSSVEFEAVECGDLRVRYWLSPHGTFPISPSEPKR